DDRQRHRFDEGAAAEPEGRAQLQTDVASPDGDAPLARARGGGRRPLRVVQDEREARGTRGPEAAWLPRRGSTLRIISHASWPDRVAEIEWFGGSIVRRFVVRYELDAWQLANEL